MAGARELRNRTFGLTGPYGLPPGTLPTGLHIQHRIKVTVVAHGIPPPFGMGFLPDGDILDISLHPKFAQNKLGLYERSTDSLLYALTEEEAGAVIRIEPTN